MSKEILRTEGTYKAYTDLIAAGGLEKGCALCSEPAIKTFTFWKLILNKYPYDRIADVHDMLVPLRHVGDADITPDEWQEYQTIKRDHIEPTYSHVMEATNRLKSIPKHFHQHLLIIKN